MSERLRHLRRRTWVLLTAGGALLVVVLAGLGIYVFVFPHSSPPPLTLTPVAAVPAVSASPAAAGAATAGAPDGIWHVLGTSQAGYRVHETLAFVGAPSDAVGRTTAVSGTIVLAGEPSSLVLQSAALTVDVSKLSSDEGRRDNRIRTVGLQSDTFPTATFALAGPVTLPVGAATGSEVDVSVAGDLTVHGVTRRVSIPLKARLSGGALQVVGSITFPFEDFGMTPPSIGGFVSVDDRATMEFRVDLGR